MHLRHERSMQAMTPNATLATGASANHHRSTRPAPRTTMLRRSPLATSSPKASVVICTRDAFSMAVSARVFYMR